MFYMNNADFVSRRCPLNDGCFSTHQVRVYNGWEETPKSTPVKLRCNGMRGVCMVMGALINLAVDGSSVLSVHIEERFVERTPPQRLSQKQILNTLSTSFSKKNQISTQLIQKRGVIRGGN